MEITEHQKRLWQSMIDMIQDCLNKDLNNFCELVGKLEGAMDALDIEEQALTLQWYDLWTPLEIRRSIEGNSPDKNKAKEELNQMKNFLLKKLAIMGM